jgi:hypothetical protein
LWTVLAIADEYQVDPHRGFPEQMQFLPQQLSGQNQA